MVLAGLQVMPPECILEFCYFKQIEHVKMLSEDIAHYNRADEGTADHSYDFLKNAVANCLRRTRRKQVRDALSKGVSGNAYEKAKDVAPSTADGGKKGKKGGGKGKDGKGKPQRERSQSADAGASKDKSKTEMPFFRER